MYICANRTNWIGGFQTNRKEEAVRDINSVEPCQCDEDEIDLRELLKVIKKRKSIIITTVILFLVLAVIYIFVSKPMYQAKATLEIGYQIVKPKTGKVSVKYFDGAERIKHYIDVKYDTSGKYRKKGTKAFLKEVDVPRKTKQFVSFIAYGLDNKLAESKLKEALNDILSQHKLYLNSAIEKTKESIDSKKRDIQYDSKVLLPQLENKLNILKTVNIKKIDTQINLIKEGNLKKIDEKIKFLNNITIPALKEKIAKSSLEIKKKLNAIKNIQKGVNSIEQAHPALAAIDTMQAANLQNDIDRLNMRIIDLQLQIKQINKQTIPDLEKQKQRILEQTIPNLEAQKEKLLKETIPSVAGSIKRLVEITIPTLKTEISLLEMSINPPYLVGTHIVGKIYTHDYPVKPKKKLIVVVAIITGIIFGIFLAFFLEFIGKEED